jgi:hypothetical protein
MPPELRDKDDLVVGQKPNASTNTPGTAAIFLNQVLSLFSASNQIPGDSSICREIFGNGFKIIMRLWYQKQSPDRVVLKRGDCEQFAVGAIEINQNLLNFGKEVVTHQK